MSAEENGLLSPESEAGSEEDVLQKLQKDVREMRENLRLQRSRNVGPEGVMSGPSVIYMIVHVHGG